MIDEKLSTVLRKVVLFDENDPLEKQLINEIKELFENESVPVEKLVMPQLTEAVRDKLEAMLVERSERLNKHYYDILPLIESAVEDYEGDKECLLKLLSA